MNVWLNLFLVSPIVLVAIALMPAAWLKGLLSANDSGRGPKIEWPAAIGLLAALAAAVLTLAPHQPAGEADDLLVLSGGLTAIMLPYVALLTLVVLRFSRVYLQGQSRRTRFIRALCLTSAAVQTLILTKNLLVFTLAWMAMSLALHKLLTYFPGRPAALLAARKKFIFSRCGDLCLMGMLWLVWKAAGTWQMPALFAIASHCAPDSVQHGELATAGLLIVIAALLKSAQFPFHTWLPNTMDAPTPVSAFMHAGIINAGGFLVLRMQPLVILCPTALWLLIIIGAVTALGGSLVMLTQTSIKRSLGFSTVAQMGFMMFELGIGAWSLALLHIIAHGIYKAYAFLSSGQLSRSDAQEPPIQQPSAAMRSAWAIGCVALQAGLWVLLGKLFPTDPLGLNIIIAVGIAYLAVRLALSARTAGGFAMAVILPVGLVLLHTLLGQLALWALTPAAATAASLSLAQVLAIIALAAAPASLELFVRMRPQAKLTAGLYVTIYKGFYLNALANRLVMATWPVRV